MDKKDGLADKIVEVVKENPGKTAIFAGTALAGVGLIAWLLKKRKKPVEKT